MLPLSRISPPVSFLESPFDPPRAHTNLSHSLLSLSLSLSPFLGAMSFCFLILYISQLKKGKRLAPAHLCLCACFLLGSPSFLCVLLFLSFPPFSCCSSHTRFCIAFVCLSSPCPSPSVVRPPGRFFAFCTCAFSSFVLHPTIKDPPPRLSPLCCRAFLSLVFVVYLSYGPHHTFVYPPGRTFFCNPYHSAPRTTWALAAAPFGTPMCVCVCVC